MSKTLPDPNQEAALRNRYTVVYEGDPAGVKILSGEPAVGRAATVMLGDLWEEVRTLRARATAAEAILREKEAEIERLTSELRGWKGVAVIAAIPLEAMRMAGSYRALAPSTQTCVDEAVVTIRMAVAGHSLPPEGDVDAALAPARAALTQPATPASSDEATR